MQTMRINYDSLREKVIRIRKVMNDLRLMRSEIGLEIGRLDWEIKCRYDIEERMTSAAKNSERLATLCEDLALRLERTIALVQGAEQSRGQSISPVPKPGICFFPIPPKNNFPGFTPAIPPIIGGIGWIKSVIITNGSTETPSDKSVWPVPNVPINYRFKDPNYTTHNGVDIPGSYGTPVHLVKGGEIIDVRSDWEYSDGISGVNAMGNYIVVKGNDGNIYRYLHLSEVGNVQVGDKIDADSIIGEIGNTGNCKTTINGSLVRPPEGATSGSHLHFDVKKDNEYIDPEIILNS